MEKIQFLCSKDANNITDGTTEVLWPTATVPTKQKIMK